MKMTNEIENLESFTVEEFQSNFDELMGRVKTGESFIIKSNTGNAVIVPYREVVDILNEVGLDEELIRIHTDHEEAS